VSCSGKVAHVRLLISRPSPCQMRTGFDSQPLA
jgi:hypothetical protein